MKKGLLVIYGPDSEYINNLTAYLGGKKGLPFRHIIFTDEASLIEYVREHQPDIIITEEKYMNPEIGKTASGDIVILTEDDAQSEEYHSVFKYQSTENIIREVLNIYAEAAGERHAVRGRSNTEIIGVYSPVGRSGKTTFAVTLGQVLAASGNALYINLEEFSAFDKAMDTFYDADLADLMYFYQQNREGISLKLKAVVQNIHGMDFVPPMVFSGDLRNMDTGEWTGLIEKIAESGIYDYVVLDIGSIVGDVFRMLEMCDSIYMPVCEDQMSMMKVTSLEEYLIKSGRGDMGDRIVRIKLPGEDDGWTGDYFERKLWGEAGDFVRSIVNQREGA